MDKKTLSRKKRNVSQRPRIEEVEPRILYSADFAPAVIDDPLASAGLPAEARLVDAAPDAFPAVAPEDILIVEAEDNASSTTRHELVIVDTATPDYQQLVDDILSRDPEGGQIDVALLDPSRDGVDQLGEILSGYADLDAVHIVSHGEAGAVSLGNATLDSAALREQSDAISGWGDALNADGDLLIYGCNLAASDAGKQLVDTLASLTRADVTASDDPTSNAARGGDWDLEYQSGQIESTVAFSTALRQQWNGVLAAELTPGLDVQVNTTDGGNAQILSADGKGGARATAMDASGNTVIVWSQQNADGSWDVKGQRFDAGGAAQGSEFTINPTTPGNQQYASVAMDDAGNFVVVWQGAGAGDSDGIFARRFDSNGNAIGGEILVNTTTTGGQTSADIDMDRTTGDFIIVWDGEGAGDANGVFFRRFDSSGTAIDPIEMLAHAATADAGKPEIDPVVAYLSGGKFVVGWEVDGDDKIFFQRFYSNGNTYGGKTQIDGMFSTSAGLSIDADASGNFVFAYMQEGLGSAVYARGFTESGGDLFSNGNLLNIWENVAAGAVNPSVAMAADGRIVVSYQTAASNGDIRAAILDPTGATINDITVDFYKTGAQGSPSVSLLDADTVTPNDPGDIDSGPNGLYPVITLAQVNGADLLVTGTHNSAANTTFTLDFYASASAAACCSVR